MRRDPGPGVTDHSNTKMFLRRRSLPVSSWCGTKAVSRFGPDDRDPYNCYCLPQTFHSHVTNWRVGVVVPTPILEQRQSIWTSVRNSSEKMSVAFPGLQLIVLKEVPGYAYCTRTRGIPVQGLRKQDFRTFYEVRTPPLFAFRTLIRIYPFLVTRYVPVILELL